MGEQDERVFSFHGRPAACGGEVPVSVIDLKGRGTAGVPDGEVQTHVFGWIPDAEGFKARLTRAGKRENGASRWLRYLLRKGNAVPFEVCREGRGESPPLRFGTLP